MRNRSAIIGYAILTVILTAGAAQGLAGTNTVTSDDIVNESLTSADVKNESLTSSDIKNESIRGSDILNGSLTSSDIAGYRRVQFAMVDNGGDRTRGTASSSDREGTGEYTVTFTNGIDVKNCAWTVTEGDFPGGSALTKKRIFSVDSDYSTREVTVWSNDPAGTALNAGFALIGVC